MDPIAQHTEDDCTICAVAMVMGPPYTYERVAEDSKKYPKKDDEGRGLPWWKDYLRDEGFEIEHVELKDTRQFSDFQRLPSGSRALFVFKIPHMGTGHIVAIDESGVIDPQDHPAEYCSVAEFLDTFRIEEWRLYSANFWLVTNKREAM